MCITASPALRPGSPTNTPLYAASEYGDYYNPSPILSSFYIPRSYPHPHIYHFVPTYSIISTFHFLLSISLGFSAIPSSSPTLSRFNSRVLAYVSRFRTKYVTIPFPTMVRWIWRRLSGRGDHRQVEGGGAEPCAVYTAKD